MAEARVVTPGGFDLQCEIRGRGTPLLLIHGWSLDQRVFAPQAADFSRRYRTISFDRRGCGRSGGAPDIASELDDIDAILDATCGDTAVHLLGLSEGGRLALRYLLTRPGRVRSAVLQGPLLDQYEVEERDDERIPMEDFIRLASTGELDELHRRWLRHPMMSYGIHGRAAELLATIVGDYDARDLENWSPQQFEFDLDVQAALPNVSVPVLLLTGTGECEARKQVAARILELMPSASELKLPGCGHMCNLGDPALYNRFAMAFLDAH
jgi:pimeloyl-ACP methyl ester carboxylesterase